MAFALVQSSGDTILPIDGFGTAQTINSWTGATNFLVGNLVIVKVAHYSGTAANTLSCTVNGKAATLLARENPSNTTVSDLLFYAVVDTGSARNVVLTPSAGSDHYIAVDIEEHSFSGTLSLVGSAATGADGNSGAPSANTSSSAASGDLAAGLVAMAGASNATVTNTAPSGATLGFNEGDTVNHQGGGGASKILSAGGAQAFSWTVSPGDPWSVLIATFNQTGGAGAQTISPSGLASAEAFGSHTVTRGTVTVTPSGLASTEAVGAHTVAPGSVSLVCTGLASAEVAGSCVVSTGAATIVPSGLTSAEAVGSHTVTPGSVSIVCTGLVSAEAFGSCTVSSASTIVCTGLATAGAFGTCQLNLNIALPKPMHVHFAGDSYTDTLSGSSAGKIHVRMGTLRPQDSYTQDMVLGDPTGHFPALNANFATRVHAYFVSGTLNVACPLSCSIGDLNDDAAATASSTFDEAIEFVDLCHANGWLCCMITVPATTEYNDPGASPYRRDKRKAYNDLLRRGDATRPRWAGADFFVDLEPYPGFGQDDLPLSGDPGGVYIQADGIHWTATGVNFVADRYNEVFSGVASRAVVSNPTVAAVQTVAPSGKATDEAHGSHTVTRGSVSIVCTGLASAEAHGSTTVTAGTTLVVTGLASAEAVGSHTVAPGAVSLVCTGLGSAETAGSCVVAPGSVAVSPSGLPSAEAHGAHVVAPGAVTLLPTGLTSAEAAGSATVTPGVATVLPTGLVSAGAFGSHVVDVSGQLNIAAQALASGEAFGTPTVVPGAVALAPSGLASAEASGTALLTLNLSPSAIGSGEGAGNPSLALHLLAQGLASAEAVGVAAVVPGAVSVLPVSLASAEVVGSHLLQVTLAVSGLPSAEAIGNPVLQNALVLLPTGLVSAEAFGAHVVLPGGVTLQPIGLASLEAFGAATVNALVFVPLPTTPDGLMRVAVARSDRRLRIAYARRS